MRKCIIAGGRPLSPRELVWCVVILIALIVVLGTLLIWYPILAGAALGVLIFAAGRAGFFERLKQGRFLDYRLYSVRSR